MIEKKPSSKNNGRYQKGISGNPRGRPLKGAPKETSLLDQLVPVELEGRVQMVTPEIAALATLWAEGITSDNRAMDSFLKNFKKFHASEPVALPEVRTIYRIPMRMGRVDSTLKLLGIIKISDGMYKVENWVVDKALKRNPALNLSGRDFKSLTRGVTNQPLAAFMLTCAMIKGTKEKPT